MRKGGVNINMRFSSVNSGNSHINIKHCLASFLPFSKFRREIVNVQHTDFCTEWGPHIRGNARFLVLVHFLFLTSFPRTREQSLVSCALKLSSPEICLLYQYTVMICNKSTKNWFCCSKIRPYSVLIGRKKTNLNNHFFLFFCVFLFLSGFFWIHIFVRSI
jgi:hypothetical protein